MCNDSVKTVLYLGRLGETFFFWIKSQSRSLCSPQCWLCDTVGTSLSAMAWLWGQGCSSVQHSPEIPSLPTQMERKKAFLKYKTEKETSST